MIAHELDDKENQSPVRFGSSHKSPDKKKARSKSIGPGGLEEADAPKHSSPDRNRRKSVASTVKSILPSKEDETKRREARRKSLANRRVSFAPEATLHTWDVIEYMRDATTSSSASSEAARRASSTYEGSESDPPSTPPEQADDDDDDSELPASPEHQRDAHQQKHRRSSAIPPMNFNNLDEDYSSSPVSGSSDAAASSEVEEDVDSDDDDGESTAMSLDQGDDTMASQESGNSTGSSARLDAALRQASNQAGTRGIDFDEYGDMSMEMAGDEITNAFKPWSQGQHFAVEDQENVNPFASVFKPGQPIDEEDEDDMSMDMTRAVGRILPQQQPQQHQEHNDNEEEGDMTMDMTRPVGAIWPASQPAQDEGDDSIDMTMDMTRPVGGILQMQMHRPSPERTVSFGDETMDLTQAIGKIHQWNPSAQPPRSALKRRLSAITTEEGSPLIKKTPQDAQRRTVAQARDAKRRRSSASRLSLGDETMDFTMAVGSIHQRQSPTKADRRQSLNSRRSSAASSAMDEQTMEFTVAAGGIINPIVEEEDFEENENISMELTSVLGKIHGQTHQGDEQPTTPHKSSSPVRTEIPTTPKDQDRFKQTKDLSAKKILTPIFLQAPDSVVKDSAGSRRSSTRKSPARSSAKSPAFLSPDAAVRANRNPAQKVPSSAAKSARSTPGFLSPAQKSPAAQPSPLPLRQNGSGQNTPSFRDSPATASQMSVQSATKSPGQKSPARKSPASVRRSTRKSLAAEHSREVVVTPSESVDRTETQPAMEEMQLEDAPSRAPIAKSEQPSHDEPVSEIRYPVLPKAEPESFMTPQSPKISAAEPPVHHHAHHHAAVAVTGSPMRTPSMTTPKQIDLEELNPPSPSLEKQLRSSPVKFASTPENLTSEEPTRTFADSIRLLNTPRKDAGTSPLKRLRTLTPKKSPAKKAMTPRKIATPKGLTPPTVNKSAVQMAGLNIAKDMFAVPKSNVPPTKIHLNEFLDLASIKFMELTASKRRHTVAPQSHDLQGVEEDQTIDLEGAVVAGACTMPMLDLFQHACRELKRYISEGKSFLKTLEVEVYEESPPFFQAYVKASPERKTQLDGHMRDAKTSARLQSKEIWYDWRSKLLDGLEDGLNRIKAGLDADAAVLGQKERLLDSVLPSLLQQYEALEKEAEQLEEAAAATSEEEKEELRESRDRLVQLDVEIEERKRMLANLQRDVEDQENLAEAYEEGKAECLAAIQEAERVKDSCRGFTIDEVQSLKGSIARLEDQTGWTITLASGSNLTMSYRNSLQLFFDTSSFKLAPTSKHSGKSENSPISLTYIGASADQSLPLALTTEKRFYLQLMRAQLQCLEQNATSIKALLDFVGNGWDTATRVAEQIRRLNLEHMVSVGIHSDEQMGVDISLMLPKVETKVRIALQLNATTTSNEERLDIKTEVTVAAKVVYGEAYNEKNMSEFVGKRVTRTEDFDGWDEAIRELRVRLVATGRKGR